MNEQKQKYRELAFVGWQNYILQPMEKGQKHKSFQEYLKMMGMEENKRSTIDDEEWERKKLELMKKAETPS